MNIKHPVITDSVNEAESFLDYIHRAGMRVLLETSGNYISAKLVGAFRVRPANCDGPEDVVEVEGIGSTREQALENLAVCCSGQQYCTSTKPRGFFSSPWGPLPAGKRGVFPRFLAT